MKTKISSLAMLLIMFIISANAQRAAVLEFNAGVGISQADVDGISAIFITYFRPAGYTMVERTQIDKVIDEQGFQRSRMTESQMVRIGKILNVSKIVVGDVNVVMGQYNVDVRVINVESGTIAATEGATFSGSSYRASMQSIAQKLASKIAISSGSTVSATTSQTTTQQRTTPYVIYGYLKVFPNDLGTFDSEPRQVIARLNQSKQYGYGTWRLPTNEELSLMRANNVIGAGTYMTDENNKGIVRLVTDKGEGEIIRYVNLGLPSGTLWKDENERSYYSYDQAVSRFGKELPNKQQFEELINTCQWSWTGNGYKVTGPNGESIFLPAEGCRDYPDEEPNSVGSRCLYWSSSPYDDTDAWSLSAESSSIYMGGWTFHRRGGKSVRLVKIAK